jgi:hypothetical protein
MSSPRVSNKLKKGAATFKWKAIRPVMANGFYACLFILSGCAVQVDEAVDQLGSLDQSQGQLRAVVDVQRTTTFSLVAPQLVSEQGNEESPDELHSEEESVLYAINALTEGDVLASMVELGETDDGRAWQNLEQAGLLRAIPELDTCRVDQEASDVQKIAGNLSLADLEHFELFSTEQAHDMAARAFPGVTPEMRGVVYTSRDRKGLGLSNAAVFELVAESSSGEVIQGSFGAPATPELVTVNNQEFSELNHLNGVDDLHFAWENSSVQAEDTIVVGVFNAEHTLYCRVDALSGAAHVPLDLFSNASERC